MTRETHVLVSAWSAYRLLRLRDEREPHCDAALSVAALGLVIDPEHEQSGALVFNVLGGNHQLAAWYGFCASRYTRQDRGRFDGRGHTGRPVENFDVGCAFQQRFATRINPVQIAQLGTFSALQGEVVDRI